MKPLNILILVALPLLSLEWNTNAQSEGELPDAAEPQLAEEGDWAARYNEAQIECHEGSMKACDSIWMDDRVLMDTFLYTTGEHVAAALISAPSGAKGSAVLRPSLVTKRLILIN